MAISEVIEKAMDEAYTGRHDVLQQTLARFNDGSAYAAQESKQSFQHAKQQFLVNAIQMLEQDGLAARIAQLKASGVFPNNLPSGGNVWTVPTTPGQGGGSV